MNDLKANFCSTKDIEKCSKCTLDLDNVHLFRCTNEFENIEHLNYNHILNGTLIEQEKALKFLNRKS